MTRETLPRIQRIDKDAWACRGRAPDETNVNDLILDPRDPVPSARKFRAALFSHPDGPTLLCSADVFSVWDEDESRYVELEPAAIRSKAYAFLEPAKKWIGRGDDKAIAPFAPNQTSVNNLIDALKAACYQAAVAPAWLIDDPNLPPASEILSTPKGLLHIPLVGTPRIIRPPTPLFFSPNALDYSFDADAPDPVGWRKFLDQLWPDDPESVELLGDWFGYCLLALTYLQKMLLIVGPPRSGKGTIARVLTAMLGAANVCAPTLSGISTNFGLWSLIGKLLAIVSDARLSGRADLAIVVERLLSISGEDSITIDRKNMEAVTVRLPTRVMILTNEIPKLADSSGALGNRFMVLNLERSFLGKEDTGLTDRLLKELPGILKWSLAGLRRLRVRGHFVQPASATDAVEEMLILGSPIKAFIGDWCAVRPGVEVEAATLFEAWQLWCKSQGRDNAGTVQTFGRDLRAAVPGVQTFQPRRDENGLTTRKRIYLGINLTLAGNEAMAVERSKGDSARIGTRVFI